MLTHEERLEVAAWKDRVADVDLASCMTMPITYMVRSPPVTLSNQC